MSSTLERPRPAGGPAPTGAPTSTPDAPVVVPAPAPDPAAAGPDVEARGFGRAILAGTALGVPAMMAIVMGVLLLTAPDWELGGLVGIALYTAIWSGVFLGGTITVGLWAGRRHG